MCEIAPLIESRVIYINFFVNGHNFRTARNLFYLITRDLTLEWFKTYVTHLLSS